MVSCKVQVFRVQLILCEPLTTRRVIAASALLLLLAGCKGEADFSGALRTETLPAEQYQQEIVTIDRLAFREQPLGNDGTVALATTLDGLAARVATPKPDSKFLRLESLELKGLGAVARRLPPDGTGAALQNDWMRIRSNLFDDRAWFARSAKDLRYAASVTNTAATETREPVAEKRAIAVSPPQAEQRWALYGAWKVDSVESNGTPIQDAELTGSVWMFDLPHLTIRSAAKTESMSAVDGGGEYLEVTQQTGQHGSMKYKLGSDGLRVAFFDNLQGKPSSFHASAGQKPVLVVAHLVPVP